MGDKTFGYKYDNVGNRNGMLEASGDRLTLYPAGATPRKILLSCYRMLKPDEPEFW